MSTTPTLVEQVAWMRELCGFQERQYATLVETHRLTRAEAERRKRLGAACLATLEKARAGSGPAAFFGGAVASLNAAGRPPLAVRAACGEHYVDNVAPHPRMLIDGDAALMAFMDIQRMHIIAVVRCGLGEPA